MASAVQTQPGRTDQGQHVSGKVFQSAKLTHSSYDFSQNTSYWDKSLICVTQLKTIFPYQNLHTNALNKLKLLVITFRSTYYPSKNFSSFPQSSRNLNSMLIYKLRADSPSAQLHCNLQLYQESFLSFLYFLSSFCCTYRHCKDFFFLVCLCHNKALFTR